MNIDLTKILKDCPKGWKFYTPVWGEVSFDRIYDNGIYVISIATERDYKVLTKEGCYLNREDAECIFFPSKDQRDWSKFTAPWLKKERDVFIARLEEKCKKEYVLKSSKDEDVRKFMQYIEKQLPNRSCDKYAFAKDLLVWLEKQGEQEEPQVYETEDGEIITYSETDGYKIIEPRFKVGDWLYANELNDYASLIKIVKIVDVFGEKRYKISRDYDSDLDLAEFDFIDKHYHLWTIQDAKDGDVLVNGSNILIFHFINNRRLMGYCHVNMDDGNFYNDIGRNECFCMIDAPVTPATKEQRDDLIKAMNDAGYEWNAETKTLEKLEKSSFHEGDWVVFTTSESVYQVEKKENYEYTLRHIFGGSLCLSFSDEKLIREWTIQDAKDGDVLEFEDHGRFVIGILSFVNKTTGKVDVSCLLECNKFKVGVFYNLDTVKPHPATKEQRDSLMKAMNDAGYEWDAEKKELNTKKINLKK